MPNSGIRAETCKVKIGFIDYVFDPKLTLGQLD